MRPDMIRVYLEKLLADGFGAPIAPDADGDYRLPGEGDFYARLELKGVPRVQVFAVAVREVAASAELLEKLNGLNASIAFARAFWILDQVLIEVDIVAESLDHPSLGVACTTVGRVAAQVGPTFAKDFGGVTRFGGIAPDEVATKGPAGYL